MKLTLKACRINVKVTARDMGQAIGVSESTIYNWEAGKYAPARKHLPNILNFFEENGMHISMDDINFLP